MCAIKLPYRWKANQFAHVLERHLLASKTRGAFHRLDIAVRFFDSFIALTRSNKVRLPQRMTSMIAKTKSPRVVHDLTPITPFRGTDILGKY